MPIQCLSLILVANNALIPVQVDEIVHRRMANKIGAEFNVKVSEKGSLEPCDNSIDYYYTPSKVIFMGDNRVLSGKQEAFVDDILDGRVLSFKTVSTTEAETGMEIDHVLIEEKKSKTKKSKNKKIAAWVAGGLGLLLTGFVINHYKGGSQQSREAPQAPSSNDDSPKKGPTPVSF